MIRVGDFWYDETDLRHHDQDETACQRFTFWHGEFVESEQLEEVC